VLLFKRAVAFVLYWIKFIMFRSETKEQQLVFDTDSIYPTDDSRETRDFERLCWSFLVNSLEFNVHFAQGHNCCR